MAGRQGGGRTSRARPLITSRAAHPSAKARLVQKPAVSFSYVFDKRCLYVNGDHHHRQLSNVWNRSYIPSCVRDGNLHHKNPFSSRSLTEKKRGSSKVTRINQTTSSECPEATSLTARGRQSPRNPRDPSHHPANARGDGREADCIRSLAGLAFRLISRYW
jgi:hypothetical protein